MNICMVLTRSKFPGDVRVENEAFALSGEGHNVFVVCDGASGQVPVEDYKGLRILRVFPPRTLWRKFNSFFFLLLLHNILWYRALKAFHAKYSFGAFHVHDLPLSATVLRLGKSLKTPVILDLHENYPFALQSYGAGESMAALARVMKRLFYGMPRWQRFEEQAVTQANYVIVVVEEMGQRLLKLGLQPERLWKVGNTLNVPHFSSFPIKQEVVARYADDFVISYIGGLARHRRLDTVIRAMPAVLQLIPNAKLIIMGETDRRPEYRALAEELGLYDRVEFLGWQKFEDVPSYIAAAHVGVLPQIPDEQTNNSMPHKLFQYWYMMKPMVVSNCTSVRRIVEETGGGIVCEADINDSQAWADALVSIYDPAVRQGMGVKGREAVLRQYNWETDSRRLIELYRLLENR